MLQSVLRSYYSRIALFLDFDQTVSCFDILSKIPDLQSNSECKLAWKNEVGDYVSNFEKNLEYAKNAIRKHVSTSSSSSPIHKNFNFLKHPKQKINEFLSHLFPTENQGIEITEKSKVLQGFTPKQLFDFGIIVKRQANADEALNAFFGQNLSGKTEKETLERDLLIVSYNWSRHIILGCFSEIFPENISNILKQQIDNVCCYEPTNSLKFLEQNLFQIPENQKNSATAQNQFNFEKNRFFIISNDLIFRSRDEKFSTGAITDRFGASNLRNKACVPRTYIQRYKDQEINTAAHSIPNFLNYEENKEKPFIKYLPHHQKHSNKCENCFCLPKSDKELKKEKEIQKNSDFDEKCPNNNNHKKNKKKILKIGIGDSLFDTHLFVECDIPVLFKNFKDLYPSIQMQKNDMETNFGIEFLSLHDCLSEAVIFEENGKKIEKNEKNSAKNAEILKKLTRKMNCCKVYFTNDWKDIGKLFKFLNQEQKNS